LPSGSPGPLPGTNIAAGQHSWRVRTKIPAGVRPAGRHCPSGQRAELPDEQVVRAPYSPEGDEAQLFPDLRYVINPSRRVDASARQAASVRSHQQVHESHSVVVVQPVTKSVAQTMFTVSRYGTSQMHGSTRTHEYQGYCDFGHHCRRRIDDARRGCPRRSGAIRTGPLSNIRDSACRLRH
jgi:hypothetical protein